MHGCVRAAGRREARAVTILLKFFTLLVSQASGWSKDTAPSNVVPMFETLLVSQASFELKDLA